MARRGGRRRRGRKAFKVPVVSLAILGGQVAASVARSGGGILPSLNHFASLYTGLDIMNGIPRWENLLVGWGPWVVKGVVSKVAGPLGRPRIPFGLPISIS